MEDKNESFSYTYSARQQEEIKNIRKKYAPPVEEDKMFRLRSLDSKVTRKAQAWAIALGVIGTLIFGSGMSMAMVSPAALSRMAGMISGIAVGLIGLGILSMAYPVYKHIIKRERQRIAPEIMRLADELLK